MRPAATRPSPVHAPARRALGSAVRKGLTLASIAVSVLLVAAPRNAHAEPLTASTVAGTLGDSPVSLGEIDAALGGSIERTWAQLDAVFLAAADGVCRARGIEALDADDPNWRVELWRRALVSHATAAAYVKDNPELFADAEPDLALVAHRLRVARYGRVVEAAVAKRIGGTKKVAIEARTSAAGGEMVLPENVGACLGHPITRSDVERFAAFPIFRRRAAIVQTACNQFDVDYSNPVLLAREAKARGLDDAKALFADVDQGVAMPSAEAIDDEAQRRYGAADDASRLKSELALTAVARGNARMALLEDLRANNEGQCDLSLPTYPVIDSRRIESKRGSSEAVRVTMFSGKTCRHCDSSWEFFDALAAEENVEPIFMHHFPTTVLPLFEEALQLECADRQGMLRDYMKGVSDPLDQGAFDRCVADDATAVAVLSDAEEAARLGFAEAVPSWVIGPRPRRGFQGLQTLRDTLSEVQVRRNNHEHAQPAAEVARLPSDEPLTDRGRSGAPAGLEHGGGPE